MSTDTITDRGEAITIVEPLIPEEASKHRAPLNDLVVELTSLSSGLRSSLPEGIRAPLADLVRSMNCYYSNLIEGHNTHPIDIERAMNKDFSADAEKRNLQLEAVAHIEVQRWIDTGGLTDHPLAPDSLREIHRRFCQNLPPELLVVHRPDETELPIVPGEFRTDFVQVGKHVAPSPGAVPRLLAHMRKMYGLQGRSGAIIATACAHHRLVWVHPFIDLNGRVSRMVAHAMLRDTVGSDGLWSAARGLARRDAEYKQHLMAADEPRHGGADGRGNLSEQRLAEFATFFLEACIDQVRFMETLMQPQRLRERIMTWCKGEMAKGTLAKGADVVMREALLAGEVERGALPALLGVSDRQTRKVTAELLAVGALKSDTQRAPLRLSFPARLASDWMPGLFPER
ncbi:MAG: cell filamentation protein Fic [Rhodobacterales bacterium RIFCSPHIGHO2_02_FULL_62_130]|jgi:Fic family protein|nr:MAG: cell filamentation protein Fic [Rhodobacterales bacterium RIFCSPHIGHO2_02_FULL_62_130]OHC53405.1 MAG: cell filamentation protein Fic [Rhodobacterales bacterium RIFCSPHIGHO2_12_FULL_62_75]HCY98452.1 cell filamentation protein Fic [Rhodobacter sp.]